MLQENACLFLWLGSGILSLQLSQCCDIVVRVDGSSEFHKGQPFPIPKDSALHFTLWGLYLEHFLWWGIHVNTSCAAVLTLCVITSNDVRVNFSVSYWFSRSRQICIQYSLFLCEHSGNPLSANFMISQHCHRSFQCTGAGIQLCTRFLGYILLIHMDKLIKILFI